MADTLALLSKIGFAACIGFAVLAVVWFIVFKIPDVIGELSGRKSRRSIQKQRDANEKKTEMLQKKMFTVILSASLVLSVFPFASFAATAETVESPSIESENQELLSFASENTEYVFGTNDGIVSEQTAAKLQEGDNGNVTYGFVANDQTVSNVYGLQIVSDGEKEGQVTIADVSVLAGAIVDADGALSVTVEADKTAGSVSLSEEREDFWESSENEDGSVETYAAASVQYTITIRFADTPDDAYTLLYADGEEAVKTNDLYNEDVTVVPADGYTLANVPVDTYEEEDGKIRAEVPAPEAFSETFTYEDEEVEKARVIYLRASDGGITAPITIGVVNIDKTVPVTGISYSNGNLVTASEGTEQVLTIKVTEKNFDPGDVTITGSIKDSAGNVLTDSFAEQITEYLQNDADWTEDGDTHTISLPADGLLLPDGIYNLTIHYADLAGNAAEDRSSGAFIVDQSAPVDLEVTYGKAIETKRVGNQTFHTYQDSVEVTFSATDPVSGVKEFVWSYQREAGVSEKNLEKYETQTVAAVQMEGSTEYTASVTLPLEAAAQLRGNLSVKAVDQYGNTSDVLTEADVVVVDSVAPELAVSYNEACRTVGSTNYYNKDVTGTFTVTEANFCAEDVEVVVTKDGNTFAGASMIWEDQSADVHVGTYTIPAKSDHTNDGNYVISLRYTDRSGNQMTDYTSGTIVVDTTVPVITVNYSNTAPENVMTDAEGNSRSYFNNTQTVTVTITEHNFFAGDVDFTILANDVNGKELGSGANVTGNALAFDEDGNALKKAGYSYCGLEWADDGDVHTITITCPGDANYTFDVAYADLAANAAADYDPDYFTVDTTPPENLAVTYSKSVLDTILNGVVFGFYNRQMTVTIRAEDNISPVNCFQYSYQVAPGVSGVNAGLTSQMISADAIHYSDGYATATATFMIPRSALNGSTQFNGRVDFAATDRANNMSASLQDAKRIVVDNLVPTAHVVYNAPVSQADGVSYYDEAVTGTVTITEANFYPDDVQVTATKDGVSYAVSTSWRDESTDVHVGTFQLSDDGDYIVTIAYRDKSGNPMTMYISEPMTVDTQIESPVITINGADGNGKAFRDEVVPAVSFYDVHYESYEISLTRTRYYDIGEDVSEEFLQPGVSVREAGGSGSFDTFEKTADTDGVYTMTAKVKDKAGHTAETVCTFTVNRYGSVYVYGDYLADLVSDGGKYVQDVDCDLTIMEYNADRLMEGSLDIDISRSGHALDDVDYDVTPEMNDTVTTGESGWYQYQYTISKDNFETEGVYRMAVSSRDEAGNLPETTNYEDKDILFRVDKNVPEINHISGLEESIINATEVEVTYSVYDGIGLASVEVYVVDADGDVDWDAAEPMQTITEFDDLNNYEGTFSITEKSAKEKSQAQAVRLVVTDLSGRVTDTADTDGDDAFAPAFAFNDTVTVSTNFLVRWFANKPLFGGSIAVMAAAGGIVLRQFISFRVQGN